MDLLCWASDSGPSGTVQGSVLYLTPLAWPALVGVSHGKARDHSSLALPGGSPPRGPEAACMLPSLPAHPVLCPYL